MQNATREEINEDQYDSIDGICPDRNECRTKDGKWWGYAGRDELRIRNLYFVTHNGTHIPEYVTTDGGCTYLKEAEGAHIGSQPSQFAELNAVKSDADYEQTTTLKIYANELRAVLSEWLGESLNVNAQAFDNVALDQLMYRIMLRSKVR